VIHGIVNAECAIEGVCEVVFEGALSSAALVIAGVETLSFLQVLTGYWNIEQQETLAFGSRMDYVAPGLAIDGACELELASTVSVGGDAALLIAGVETVLFLVRFGRPIVCDLGAGDPPEVPGGGGLGNYVF